MKVEIVYDGACPFCDDYVRYQRLRSAVDALELVDARSDPSVLQARGLTPADLEDGMVVFVDGVAHHGADAVHVLALLGERPGRGWIRLVARISRSRRAARALYPVLKLGRRLALAALGVPRFPRTPSRKC